MVKQTYFKTFISTTRRPSPEIGAAAEKTKSNRAFYE